MARLFASARAWLSSLHPETRETLRFGRQVAQYCAAVYVIDQHVVHLSVASTTVAVHNERRRLLRTGAFVARHSTQQRISPTLYLL